MIRHGVALAGAGFPARNDGIGLATAGMIMPMSGDVAYPLRVALSKTYRGVSVGVTE